LQDDFVASFQKLADWEQTLILSSLQRVAQMLQAEQMEVVPSLEAASLHETDAA